MSEATASPPSVERGEGYYKVYEEYAKALRTWLVAYGIGGPVLLVNNDAAQQLIKKNGNGALIAGMFLAGVSLQVLLATINKTAMWALYWGEEEVEFTKTCRYCFATWIARQYWIDFLLDILAIGLFAVATFMAFRALVA